MVRLETLYRDKISTILENLDDKQTILHGDYHCGNIMFLKGVDDAIILDWQMYGHGHFAYEFVYFVYIFRYDSSIYGETFYERGKYKRL